jgi:nucleoside-diphosphate-sugar epimerase
VIVSNETIITEEIRWNPEKPHMSDYAISKYGAEMEIWRVSKKGLDVIIVNPELCGPGFQGSSLLGSCLDYSITPWGKEHSSQIAMVRMSVELMKSSTPTDACP